MGSTGWVRVVKVKKIRPKKYSLFNSKSYKTSKYHGVKITFFWKKFDIFSLSLEFQTSVLMSETPDIDL